MRFLIILILFIFSYAENMEILANHFEYNQENNLSQFIGNVKVTKNNEKIESNKLIVYTTKDRKLYKLIAQGNVKFKITNQNATYIGTSDKLTYIKPKQLFILEGHVHITKTQDNQQLFGNKVIIDKKNGTANVIGSKNKPIKFIIKVN